MWYVVYVIMNGVCSVWYNECGMKCILYWMWYVVYVIWLWYVVYVIMNMVCSVCYDECGMCML